MSDYDCTGHADGNYVHPDDCTKFISCVAEKYAYEMDCPAGLHYHHPTDRCEWPEIAGCVTGQPAG
ncbi:hypothetical protein Lfu02_00010 [Longispora fulva]|uniref:Chitin-binding type-2 domain-containing protein n=1 Tax=Longispora fulva TaxID=619741 RepID=A0A8J7KFF7_9ACTN|nr:chitin binding peritrophin-A domain-containing protein [Longispora fulva]MBG6136125.1 hypothetical protein [Longispora fulva]GIG55629.1 hypothetical protein Lfu02_00010 [Longispora fulva]